MLNKKCFTLLTWAFCLALAFLWFLAIIPPPGAYATTAKPGKDSPSDFSGDDQAASTHNLPETVSPPFTTNYLLNSASIQITETKKITASDGSDFDQFGLAVAVSGDTAVVGANQDPAGPGAAYVFERNQGGANNWARSKS